MWRIAFAVLLSSCGSSTSGLDGGGGGNADLTMAAGAVVPDPGHGSGVDNNFGNVEPNDTPAQATPLGVASMGDVHVWVSGNNIGGAEAADYFVFKSAAKAGQFTFSLCWSGAIKAMTATLWKVDAGHQVLPPIHQWMATGGCVMSAQTGDAPLAPSTVYLFGVQATSGGAGMYSA